MTYLETPLFGENKIINNKPLNKLITIPKKYKLINDNFRIFTAIILLPIIINILYTQPIKLCPISSLVVMILFFIWIYAINNFNKSIGTIIFLVILKFFHYFIYSELEKLDKYIIKYINPFILFNIGFLLLCCLAYYVKILKYMTYTIFFVSFIIGICYLYGGIFYSNIASTNVGKFCITLLLFIQFVTIDNINTPSKIYEDIDLFINKSIKDNLMEIKLFMLTHKKYNKNTNNNTKDMKLCENEEFLKFLNDIYLKDPNEPLEEKKIAEDYLKNIDIGYLRESEAIALSNALNKYIQYSQGNKLQVELIDNMEFLKFLKDIYLKDSNEPLEEKKIAEDYLNTLESLIESEVTILSNVLNKYIQYSEKNKFPVELIDHEPFIEFIEKVYLKDNNEPSEEKKIVENYINNIQSLKEERLKMLLCGRPDYKSQQKKI